MNETPHEYEFWNRYFRLDDEDKAKPYFNPVTLRRAEAGFPHSNSATIRKNTFAGKWNAATRTDSQTDEHWTLTESYADIFRTKVLTKGDNTVRVPVLDLAILIFRTETFDDAADARTLVSQFRAVFPQRSTDFDKIFVFFSEDENKIFDDVAAPQDYESAIKSALVDDVKSSSAVPAAHPSPIMMDLSDPILVQVQKLLAFGTSGIIFTGAPGTGKSYYAKRVAKHLVKDPNADIFKVQFHPSYGYEDFVEGYRPDETATSGYKIVEKTFVLACERAQAIKHEDRLVVLIVDEINRGDPARVFGELLTYIERTYRNEQFTLPFSGKHFSVSDNLILLGTMNPFDRSVAQVDAAFVRRFDHIEISPSREVVEDILEKSGGFTPEHVAQIGMWFETAQNITPFGIGHSFFADVKNLEHLKLVWRYRIRPTAAQAMEVNDGAIENLTASFNALIRRIEGTAEDA